MDFIQSQIDRGYTRIMITNRGERGNFESNPFKVYKYDIETVEDYNNIVESDLHANHQFGYSVGFAPSL
ncbi:hypothetical protein N9H78_03685 [Winogradskyella sp.]|nr:hypothetical protein [Winogradskyella sp.]MDA8874755.1 hypothetical protein [Winogradskyella sp.]